MQNRRGRARTKSISAVDFEALRPFLTHLNPDRVEAARLALVEYKSTTLEGIAVQYDVKRQSVERSILAVWKVYQAYLKSLEIRFGTLGDDVELMAIPTALVPVVESLVKASNESPKRKKS
jgi:hypothetical protein